jgi:amidophosphoribosyltransferase
MCGIIGISSLSSVNTELYDGLLLLQHRGQDSAGIATCTDDGRVHSRKAPGLVRDVFFAKHFARLAGDMGIGHVRYPTAGTSSSFEAQPFYVNSPYGISMVHNGNLTNASFLAEELFKTDFRHINTKSDSEILLNVFAHELHKQQSSIALQPSAIFAAVQKVYARCQGAYSVIAMVAGQGIIGFRDPLGIRPFIIGVRESVMGKEYMLASESVALSGLGYKILRDVAPGECIFIDKNKKLHSKICANETFLSPCLFEYVYFARPDSIIDDVSVYKARLRMGQYLADKIKKEYKNLQADVVIPIPDTSRTSALELANQLGVPYREGFIKNRYIGRTFIMNTQSIREKSVKQKLNPIELEFRGKKVLLVDDSIVRGTTSKQIIQMAREAGATKVYMASAAPPVRYQNVYGIDMPSVSEFIANVGDVTQICDVIGADELVYQDLDDLILSVQRGNKNIKQFECSCFNGEYITGDVDKPYLRQLEITRKQ